MTQQGDKNFNRSFQQNQGDERIRQQNIQTGPGDRMSNHARARRLTEGYRMSEAINTGWTPFGRQELQQQQQQQDISASSRDSSHMSIDLSLQAALEYNENTIEESEKEINTLKKNMGELSDIIRKARSQIQAEDNVLNQLEQLLNSSRSNYRESTNTPNIIITDTRTEISEAERFLIGRAMALPEISGSDKMPSQMNYSTQFQLTDSYQQQASDNIASSSDTFTRDIYHDDITLFNKIKSIPVDFSQEIKKLSQLTPNDRQEFKELKEILTKFREYKSQKFLGGFKQATIDTGREMEKQWKNGTYNNKVKKHIRENYGIDFDNTQAGPSGT